MIFLLISFYFESLYSLLVFLIVNDFNAYNLTNGVETDPQSQRRSSLSIPAEAFAESAVCTVQPASSENVLFHKK
jgi:hypothetical protein